MIVESFERIHRSNLIGMGVLPLVFMEGVNRETLGLDGTEVFDIGGIAEDLTSRKQIDCTITRADGTAETIPLLCRIDTLDELDYYRNGRHPAIYAEEPGRRRVMASDVLIIGDLASERI